ncbi:hypothetical protein PR048_025738 [Dryococelus australis]|uniref:Uncharacterized protein n=1 Tax=Dryococelus australis TaxID=614101 RepID=A0ABQ9GJA3_9NEOP|nr:hypothetical protein PR048_025738 [Dryococelus australis]
MQKFQGRVGVHNTRISHGSSVIVRSCMRERERERYIVGLIKDDGHCTCLCLCCDAPARDEALAGSVLAAVCPAGPGGQDTPGEDKYTTQYDNVDIDAILNNERILKNYVNYLLDK